MTLLSFKCRAYGDRLHEPCSGTTDDGTGRDCECPCHEGDDAQDLGEGPTAWA